MKKGKNQKSYFDTFKWPSKESETTFFLVITQSQKSLSLYLARIVKKIIFFQPPSPLPIYTLWHKNHENRRDRKSHTWSPLSVVYIMRSKEKKVIFSIQIRSKAEYVQGRINNTVYRTYLGWFFSAAKEMVNSCTGLTYVQRFAKTVYSASPYWYD